MLGKVCPQSRPQNERYGFTEFCAMYHFSQQIKPNGNGGIKIKERYNLFHSWLLV
jgi:hypothetical protein